MVNVDVLPAQTAVGDAETVGTVGSVHEPKQAIGNVKGVSLFTSQLATFNIAVLSVEAVPEVTEQSYIALSTSGVIANEFVAFNAEGRTDLVEVNSQLVKVASHAPFMPSAVISVGDPKVP